MMQTLSAPPASQPLPACSPAAGRSRFRQCAATGPGPATRMGWSRVQVSWLHNLKPGPASELSPGPGPPEYIDSDLPGERRPQQRALSRAPAGISVGSSRRVSESPGSLTVRQKLALSHESQ